MKRSPLLLAAAISLVLAACGGSGPYGNSADGYYIDPSEARWELSAERPIRTTSTTLDPAVRAEHCGWLQGQFEQEMKEADSELVASINAWEAFEPLRLEFYREYGVALESPMPRLNEMMGYRLAAGHRLDAVEYGCDWPDHPAVDFPDEPAVDPFADPLSG